MNESTELFEIHKARFKAWIKKRFISEVDIASMPSEVGLAWAAALIELGCEIQIAAFHQAQLIAHVHEVVPFRRRGQ
ncbi:hypothetical protein CEN50_22795 [Fischerella thermalis CCMEE 5268]|uniref:Uncharacterized protein n=1 Tax=Fischerella thermalis CCMEE 5268 TaxID=2019662 RepID=A0A2N6KAK8_9CYAN|nr:hypothetical protein [Fischerella thermalis]PLZ95288.1 hypothetical protein CEN50_22795 [Fischerella thermalis CCMEE 5268]